jgi:hypothetical protein
LPLVVGILSEYEKLQHQTDLAAIEQVPQLSRPLLRPSVGNLPRRQPALCPTDRTLEELCGLAWDHLVLPEQLHASLGELNVRSR